MTLTHLRGQLLSVNLDIALSWVTAAQVRKGTLRLPQRAAAWVPLPGSSHNLRMEPPFTSPVTARCWSSFLNFTKHHPGCHVRKFLLFHCSVVSEYARVYPTILLTTPRLELATICNAAKNILAPVCWVYTQGWTCGGTGCTRVWLESILPAMRESSGCLTVLTLLSGLFVLAHLVECLQVWYFLSMKLKNSI